MIDIKGLSFQRIRRYLLGYLYCNKIRKQNKNENFTIIASNCIGTAIYKDLDIKYQTPTVGLLFFAPCYIKLISNLRYFLESPLIFTKTSKYLGDSVPYPIGLLDNEIEIHFLHNVDEQEAYEKWTSRLKRVNYSNLYFIFTDRDLATEKEIEEFDKLDYENKVCFTAKEYPNLKSTIFVKEYDGCEYIGDLYSSKLYRKYLDVVGWLNK